MKQCLFIILALFSTACSQATKRGYSGHGEGSLSDKVVAKFAPQPLPPQLSRTIQSTLDLRSPGMGIPSPDGKSLYFSWTVTGVRQIWKLKGPRSFPIQMTGGEDATYLEDISPDGRWLSLSRDINGQEYPGIYLQKTKGGPLKKVIHEKKVKTYFSFFTDDSQALFYTANNIDPKSYAIYRYDIKSGKQNLIFSQPGTWFIADSMMNGNLLLLVNATGSLSREYFLYSIREKKLTPLFGQNEKEYYSAQFGQNKKQLIVLTDKFDEYPRLYSWRGGAFKPITPKMTKEVDRFSVDPKRKRILYTLNDRGYTQVHAMDLKTKRRLSLPNFKGADHVFTGVTSHNSRYTTVGVVRHNSPRTSYLYDWKRQRLTQWVIPSSPEIDTSDFVKASLEWYPARDGTKIPMFVSRPNQCKNPKTPCPVIVDFHGGPEAQRKPGFRPRTQLYLKAGFIYVEPNVRGSSGYGKTWLHADDGPKRLKVITDIQDCGEYIKKNWTVGGQTPKVGVVGGSYGGYSVFMAMTQFAGTYDAGVAIVGMSSLLTFLKNTAPYRRHLRTSEYGDPEKDLEALKKLSPLTYIDRAKDPLLIIHGVNDPRVPAGEAKQIYDILQRKNVPSELILFGDEGHGVRKRKNRVLSTGHALNFFKKTLF